MSLMRVRSQTRTRCWVWQSKEWT